MSRLTAALRLRLVPLIATVLLAAIRVTVLADSDLWLNDGTGPMLAPTTAPAPPSTTSALGSDPYPGPTASPTVVAKLFLPLLLKSYGAPGPAPSSTPSPTNTPTPVPTACDTRAQVVENPSFETGWPPWELTHGDAFRVEGPGIDGSYFLGFGGANNEMERVVQNVLVPEWAERGAVYFWWRMVSDDSPTNRYDFFNLQIWDTYGGEYDKVLVAAIYNSDDRETWYRTREELGSVVALRGHPLLVVLRTYTDESYPTWWGIDDVQLVFACGSQVP